MTSSPIWNTVLLLLLTAAAVPVLKFASRRNSRLDQKEFEDTFPFDPLKTARDEESLTIVKIVLAGYRKDCRLPKNLYTPENEAVYARALQSAHKFNFLPDEYVEDYKKFCEDEAPKSAKMRSSSNVTG